MYNIGDNLFHSNTFFNYPSFIKYLNIFKVIISVEKWFETAVGTLKPENRYLLLNSNISASNFERLIYMSLFEIFIKNEVNLHTLEIEIISNIYNMYYDIILELILQNIDFIHNIKNLNFYNNYNEQVEIKNRTLQLINSHQYLKKILLSYNNFPLYQSLLLSKDYN
ncbi:hypothetical protein RhiirA1_485683, partial [Rhizophagus irregularis]